MPEPTVICPSCKSEIKLTESLAAPLLVSAQQRFERELAQRDEQVTRKLAELRERERLVAESQRAIDEQVSRKLIAERQIIATEEAKKARLALDADLQSKDRIVADLTATIKQLNDKLAHAQKSEAEALRKQRELDDAKRELDLTVEKRIGEGLTAAEAKARQRADEDYRLKLAEREKIIADHQRQIDEMRRKMEQGSQQMQGEVQELELESLLRERFARDTIEPVPKGQHGGDAVQRVIGPLNQPCGSILWESKRTKAWSDTWLSKLRDDQRAAKAEVAVIVTQTLPKQVETFDLIDGVYVTSARCVVPLACALREALIQIATARRAGQGLQTKIEMVYEYLTSSRFRLRVEAIVEAFSTMQEELEKERRAMNKIWEKRREQIDRVMHATTGMYGELQSIAGSSLHEIKGLELNLLTSDETAG